MPPRLKRPFVFMNLAMSADGKIATANRHIASFGSARDTARLFDLRSEADAILCGATTINRFPVDLGPGSERHRNRRIKSGLAGFPERIVVSGSGSLDPGAHLFSKRFSPILVLTTDRMPPDTRERLAKVADEIQSFGSDELDVPGALDWLHRKRGIRRLLCEGGGATNDALLRAGVVDRIHVTVCPWLVGGRSAPTLADGRGQAALATATRLHLKSLRRSGGELFLTYDVIPGTVAAG